VSEAPTKRPGGTVGAEALRERLRHVYWIGGASAAGKSTIARRIAAQHRFSLYATDDVMSDHASRSTPENCPLLRTFMAMTLDERWVHRSPQTMFETFHWFQGEGFDMIVEDLLRFRGQRAVIAEGLRLLPGLVEPLAVPGRAVWLLPTSDFRRVVFDRRGPAWGFLAKISDPETALRNLLERDRMFTERLHEETMRLELPVIEVETRMTEDDLARRVMDAFGL
jgi:2-phosphoglycerate kinase